MPDIIRGLRHVVLYETFKETMPKYLKLGKYYEMTNTLDNYGAHRVKLGCIFFLYEGQRRSLVVTRDKITTKATGGNDRGRGCDVL